MSKQLYTVKVEFDFVIVAESLREARAIAPNYIHDALNDISVHDTELFVTGGVSAEGWDGECIPYGGDGTTRTKEYV